MKVEIFDIGTVDEKIFKYAVIASKYNGKWVLCKHQERDTWEIPGGSREKGESLLNTAKRELYEETGARTFEIREVCDYSVTVKENTSYGRLFLADIREFGKLPKSEIEKIDFFDILPGNMTYPDIQPLLHQRILMEI